MELTSRDIVSVEKGDRGRIYDAHGKQVNRCLAANLLTGECVVFAEDAAGKVLVDWDAHIAKTRTVHRPAPLRFEPWLDESGRRQMVGSLTDLTT